MTWDLYECVFRLKSPLHIGCHKVLHLSRTRPYIPGKLIWAALTSKLTPALGINDYPRVGQFLKNSIRYGYFYLWASDKLYLPQYTEEGLKFGELQQNTFEKKFISTMASSAIQPQSLTAEEGMLHEIEFINPTVIDNGEKVFLKGLLWINEISEEGLNILKEDNETSIFSNNEYEVKIQKGLQLHIGGERRSGFGLVELKEIKKISNSDLTSTGFFGEWKEQNKEIVISLRTNDPIWAHAKHSSNLKIKGDIEFIVGREWDTQKGAGKLLRVEDLSWVPGSILIEDKKFKITDFGLWEAV